MAFEMYARNRSVVIDGGDERILYELPRGLGIATPQCDFLWEAFYRDPVLNSPAQVRLFRDEVDAIRAAHSRERKQILQRERNVHAKDPKLLDEILTRMLAGDAVLAKCDELIALCDDAIANGVGVRCSSD